MGTYAIIDLPDENKVYEAYRYLKDVENKLSDYIDDSEISQINKMAGITPVKVSPLTLEIIEKSLKICDTTKGAFDITVGSITINYKRKKIIPYNEAKELVNCKDIIIDKNNQTVFLKKKNMAIDLGGIGKGFAVEKAYDFVKSDQGFISIAGDMKIWGQKRKIAIYNPFTKTLLMEANNHKNVCISTSGNYFQNHIIGKSTDLMQVSVFYDECSFTDAISTGIFAMDKDFKDKFLKDADFGYLIVYNDGTIQFNKKIFNYLENIKFFNF
jgi:thiamine biosynthesis lipoprotein